jgi:D,D-heptose 1,7-bisphosphate phosphatase
MSRPACFLDRDGTLTQERGYAATPGDIELLPGAGAAVRLLNRRGMAAVLITNQSGVGRGYFTIEDVAAQHEKLRQLLAVDDAHLDGIYVCPHHPDERCGCRKPATALLIQAARELDLDLSRSWMIGDREEDLAAGERAAGGSLLVLTGYGEDTRRNALAGRLAPDRVFADVLAAVNHLLAEPAQ